MSKDLENNMKEYDEATKQLGELFDKAIEKDGPEQIIKEVGIQVVQLEGFSQELNCLLIALQQVLVRNNIIKMEELQQVTSEVVKAHQDAIKEQYKQEV